MLVLHGGPLSDYTEPIGDIDGSAEYTRPMIRVFVRRALQQALTAAPAG